MDHTQTKIVQQFARKLEKVDEKTRTVRTARVISVEGRYAVVAISGKTLHPMTFMRNLNVQPGQNVRVEIEDNVPRITGIY